MTARIAARAPAAALCLALAGCAAFPAFEVPGEAAALDAPYPAIAPLTDLLARAETDPAITADEIDALLARAARLRARAAPGPGSDDLEARAARLREKAARLRAAPPA